MRHANRLVVACVTLVAAAAQAAPQNPRDPTPGAPLPQPMAAIRADRWNEAQAAAAAFADPVPEKLALYYRLLAPGAATAPEIAAFMTRNPDWPGQALLERKRQEAIAAEPDQATVIAQCAAGPITLATAQIRCAEAIATDGRPADAATYARTAWVDLISDPALEAVFLKRWAGVLTPSDQWDRFRRLAWRDTASATRQVTRVPAARHAEAEAWLALKRDDPQAEASVASLPPDQQADPGLVLDHARSLRRTGRLTDALVLWQQSGAQAQAAAPAHAADFWAERNLIARKLLQVGENAGAYAIVSAHGELSGEPLLDAEFLAGFIALRRLKDAHAATAHFHQLAAASDAAITQARAWFWLGQASEGTARTTAYRHAASWPTTFYGQLAAIALGEDTGQLARRIQALRDPPFSKDVVLAFGGHEVARAALWLAAWGESRRAATFLLRMDEIAPVPAERSLTAALALQLGLPDTAVFIARRIGRDGSALPQTGWPVPYTPPPPLDPAIALGIMRQESSFDVGAVSPSGARGLMQLMPFTAQGVARKLSIGTSLGSLTADPGHNMRLGTSYVQEMLDHFGGSLPLAVAAYNAGPHRVDEWLAQYGDPRGESGGETSTAGQVGMLDWLELIPIAETRNYVQRVLENVVIYRARRNEPTATLQAQWMR